MKKYLVLGLIALTLISCKPQLVKTGTRTVVDKDFKELGEYLYNLSYKCWDRGPGLLEVEQIVKTTITDSVYIISVHAFSGDTNTGGPLYMSIKGDGLLYPYFKVTLMKDGNNTIVQTEERGRAYGREEYFSSEVRSWLNGSKRCSRHR